VCFIRGCADDPLSLTTGEQSVTYAAFLREVQSDDRVIFLGGNHFLVQRNKRWFAYFVSDLLPFLAVSGVSGGFPVARTTTAVASDNALVVRWSVGIVSLQAGSIVGLSPVVTQTTASPLTTTDTATLIGAGAAVRAIRNTSILNQCRLGGSDVTQGSRGFLLNITPGTVDLPSLIVFGAPVQLYVVSEVLGAPATVEWC